MELLSKSRIEDLKQEVRACLRITWSGDSHDKNNEIDLSLPVNKSIVEYIITEATLPFTTWIYIGRKALFKDDLESYLDANPSLSDAEKNVAIQYFDSLTEADLTRILSLKAIQKQISEYSTDRISVLMQKYQEGEEE